MTSKTVSFTVGGRVYAVPPMSFRMLEKCWADVQALGAKEGIFESTRATLRVLAHLVSSQRPELSHEDLCSALEEELGASEAFLLDRDMSDLFHLSGLGADAAGGAPAAGTVPGAAVAESPQTGTQS